MTTIDTTDVLSVMSRICGCGGGRYSTQDPTPYGDWIYATNGHMIMRFPRRNVDVAAADAPDNVGMRWLAVFMDGSFDRPDTFPAPAIKTSVMTGTCPLCHGFNRPEGINTVTEEGDCIRCNGEGVVVTAAFDELLTVRVQLVYSRIIRLLEGLMIWPRRMKGGPALCFSFNDGGQGILMGCADQPAEKSAA